MKKLIPLLVLLGIVYNVKAQLTVADDNNVGIGVTNPVSKLAIGGAGDNLSTLYVLNNTATSSQRAAYFYKSQSGDTGSDYSFSVLGHIANSGGYKLIGGIFQAHTSTASPSSNVTVGLRAIAGNGYDGRNYGVFGYLYGNRDGAAIYGCIDGYEPVISGKYAGYFRGNVYVTGTVDCNDLVERSDINLKKEIRPLSEEGISQIDKLKRISSIKYKYKNPVERNEFSQLELDTMKVDPRTLSYDEAKYTKDNFGLSAQEVQGVFPELVSQGSDGYLRMNYIGLIPVFVEAIKEQDELISQQSIAIQQLDSTLRVHEETLYVQKDSIQLLNETILQLDQAYSLQNTTLQEQANTILALDQSLQTQATKIDDLVAEIEEIKKSISTK